MEYSILISGDFMQTQAKWDFDNDVSFRVKWLIVQLQTDWPCHWIDAQMIRVVIAEIDTKTLDDRAFIDRQDSNGNGRSFFFIWKASLSFVTSEASFSMSPFLETDGVMMMIHWKEEKTSQGKRWVTSVNSLPDSAELSDALEQQSIRSRKLGHCLCAFIVFSDCMRAMMIENKKPPMIIMMTTSQTMRNKTIQWQRDQDAHSITVKED